jgi:hypothetical protein
METVAGLIRPSRHALHRKKARVDARLASVSPYDNIDKKGVDDHRQKTGIRFCCGV